MIHGCWLILTKEFFRHFKVIPCPTFLFAEEDFIAYNCKLRKMPIVHTDQIIIQHYGQKSTNSSNRLFSWRRSQQRQAQKKLIQELSFRKLLRFWIDAKNS